MSNSKKITHAALASVVSMGILGLSQQAIAATPPFEKCYGIVAAGKNDCGTVLSACAATAKTANACYAWIYLPQDICQKIAGSSTGKPAASCVVPTGKPVTK